MKQKIVIVLSVLLLLAVIYLIAKDLFSSSPKNEVNPCEYNIDKLKEIDSSLICYKEINQFDPDMQQCSGIAVDAQKNMYISGNKVVSIFDSKAHKTRSFKVDTSANCIAVDNDDIYLGMGNHVEHFNRSGLKLSVWKAFNSKSLITSIAVNNKNVYVADAINKRVLKYTLDGKLELVLGAKDTSKGNTGFIVPSPYFDVVFGAFNDLWVVNPGKHRIENYSSLGELQSSWGLASIQLDGFAGCCNPVHIAVLPNGAFVTYEKGLDRIKIYDPTGKFECVVAGPTSFKGKSDFHCSQSSLLNDLTTDLEGNIYVLDAYNQVRIYAKK